MGSERRARRGAAKGGGWRPYEEVVGHSLPWPLEVLPDLVSPQLGFLRPLVLWRPPPGAEGPFPVLVFLDGQNLFDPATGFGRSSWRLGQTLEGLHRRGIDAVAVGVANGGRQRLREYAPFVTGPPGRSVADATLAFLVETVLPKVEARIDPGDRAPETAILGASLGGLFALYASFLRPDVFSWCGAISPSLQVRRADIFRLVRRSPAGPDRIYLDVGTREVSRPRGKRFNSRHYSANVTAMRDLLLKEKGYRRGRTLLHVRETYGVHHESAWGRRLPRGLEFLLTGRDPAARRKRG